MSVRVPPIRPRATSRSHRPPATVVALMALFGLLTVGALQGGIAMVVDPLTPLDMPTSFLDRAPIDTYLWPGMFLLGVAAASALTIAGLTLNWPSRWARAIENAVGYRWPWIAAITTGSVLLTFEIIELFMVPFHPVMHPLLIAGSLAIVALALAPSARSHLRAQRSGQRGRAPRAEATPAYRRSRPASCLPSSPRPEE